MTNEATSTESNPYLAPKAKLRPATEDEVPRASVWSRRLFAAEVILIAIPLSVIYLALGLPVLVWPAFELPPRWTDGLPALLALVVLAAVVSAWVLIVSFLMADRAGLRRRHRGWWWCAFAGAIVVAWALVSATLVPDSPEYSEMWSFRFSLHLFIAGTPLLLPLGHLRVERIRGS